MENTISASNYVSEAIKRQTFADKTEMDEAIKQHLGEHGADLTDTAVEILRLLSRYAVKYPGVAFLKNATIAKKIGKSRITVIRNIKRLVDAGIIERVNVMRAINGGNGANMYVIKPADTPQEIHRDKTDKPTYTSDIGGDLATEPLFNTKHYHYILDTAEAVKNAIPTVIFDAISPFFNAADLFRLTGVIYRAKTAKIRLEDHAAEFRALMLDVIRRYKAGSISSLDGYLFASIRKLSRRLYLGCA